MKVADVYYEGRSRRHSRRGPTDKRYSWLKTTSKVEDIPEEVEDVEDALHFEGVSVFRVEWTPLGRIAKEADGPVTETEAALQQVGYRTKQKLAKSLGLKADGSEDELDERIEPHIQELQQQMEA